MLIRHGETAHNAGGLAQGRVDMPLSELGQRQAEAVAAHLAREQLDAVISSPLRRARQTAEAIAVRHNLSVATEPDLSEMDVGDMDGLSGPEMRARYPDIMRAWGGPEGPSVHLPNGESLEEVQVRAWSAVEHLRAAHGDSTVVMVAHNFVIATIVCRAIGLPLTHFRRFRHTVASRTVLQLRDERAVIEVLADTCGLPVVAERTS